MNFATDTNIFIKHPEYQKFVDFRTDSKEQLKDGEHFVVKIGDWKNTDINFGIAFLCQKFKERGFESTVEYLDKKVISSELFSEEQIKQIEESKLFYGLKMKLIQ